MKEFLLSDVGLAMRSLPRAVPLVALGLAAGLGAGIEALATATYARGVRRIKRKGFHVLRRQSDACWRPGCRARTSHSCCTSYLPPGSAEARAALLPARSSLAIAAWCREMSRLRRPS